MITTHDGAEPPEAAGMRPVRALRLALAQRDGRWEILVNGRSVGGFALRDDAQRCVLDIAGQTRCDGYPPVEVLTETAAGEPRSFASASRRAAP